MTKLFLPNLFFFYFQQLKVLAPAPGPINATIHSSQHQNLAPVQNLGRGHPQAVPDQSRTEAVHVRALEIIRHPSPNDVNPNRSHQKIMEIRLADMRAWRIRIFFTEMCWYFPPMSIMFFFQISKFIFS